MPEQVAESKTPPHLIIRLDRACRLVNLGVPQNWPLERRAKQSMLLLGEGGNVSLQNPSTIRRAATILENAQ